MTSSLSTTSAAKTSGTRAANAGKSKHAVTSPPCPCGRPASYAACCARWHAGPQRLHAPDAESLMRSRYCAFVLDDLDYLLDTWHPTTRPTDLSANPPGLKWLGLTVHNHTVEDATHATVTFVARNRLQGRASRLEETSRFVREHEQWFYIDGDLTA